MTTKQHTTSKVCGGRRSCPTREERECLGCRRDDSSTAAANDSDTGVYYGQVKVFDSHDNPRLDSYMFYDNTHTQAHTATRLAAVIFSFLWIGDVDKILIIYCGRKGLSRFFSISFLAV